MSWNLITGKNLLYVSRQHGHSVETMWRTYSAWMDGAVESDIALIKASMEQSSAPDPDEAINSSAARPRSTLATTKIPRFLGLGRLCQSIWQYAQGLVS